MRATLGSGEVTPSSARALAELLITANSKRTVSAHPGGLQGYRTQS
jgi:hypothetical protein